jgi:predicted DNA-binding protein with PD1-like motif
MIYAGGLHRTRRTNGMKATEIDEGPAVTHTVTGDPGDDAIGVLTDFARDRQLGGAKFSAVGGFQRATVGWFDHDRQDYNRIEVDGPSQVLSLLGDITAGPSGPEVAAQVVLGLPDGSTRGGRLLAATVWPSLEIAIRDARSTERKPARVAPTLKSRSLAMLCGVALILLGAWGALSPFIGPSFAFGFAPDQTWVWSSARGWLEVLPGCVAAVGGLVMIISPSRLIVASGGAIAAIAGGWFIVGPSLAGLLRIGSIGAPLDTRPGLASLEWVALFYGLGGVILILVAFVLGRLSARGFAKPMLVRPAAATVAAEAAPSENRPIWEGSPAIVGS